MPVNGKLALAVNLCCAVLNGYLGSRLFFDGNYWHAFSLFACFVNVAVCILLVHSDRKRQAALLEYSLRDFQNRISYDHNIQPITWQLTDTKSYRSNDE